MITTAILLQSFSDPYINLKKRVTDKQYKYEFYTTAKKLSPRNDITYYWFKGGAIHNSQEGIAGELLNDQFDKFYLNNQLAERGKFKKGKKVGMWRTWHSNGVLATEAKWAGGQKNGNYYSYDEQGKLIEKGLYRVDKKQGKWINFFNKDTITYRDNKLVLKKEKKTKEDKEAAKILKKADKEKAKKNKELKKSQKKEKHTSKNKKTEKAKNKSNANEKKGFLKKIFSKKDKTKSADVKST